MLFTKDNADKVMRGLKTKTRRPIADDDVFKVRDGVVWTYDKNGKLRKKWEVGKTYAVQPGRGKRGIGFVRLLSICKENLQDISEEDARREGCDTMHLDERQLWVYRSRQDFALLWDSIYPKGLKFADNPSVWVLSLEIVQG